MTTKIRGMIVGMTNPYQPNDFRHKCYEFGARMAETWEFNKKRRQAMQELLQHFRNALYYYRAHDAAGVKREKRITQPQMAQAAGVNQSAVSRALQTTKSGIDALIALAGACDVPAPVFLRKVADLAAGEETRAVPLNELDDMRIDRESLQEDLANTRALLKLANEECASLRTRLAEWLRAP